MGEKNYNVTNYIYMEVSSLIYEKYKNGKLGYAYTAQTVGKPHSTGTWWWNTGVGRVPKKAAIKAYIHAHPNGTKFSQADKNIAVNTGIRAYVAVPRDNTTTKLLVYMHNGTQYETTTVKEKITFKALTAKRKQSLVSAYSSRWENHLPCTAGHNCDSKVWPNPNAK